MINSMTGYASDTILVGDFSLDAEIKSVNSKSFDLKIYLPEYMTFMENDIRQLVSKQIARLSLIHISEPTRPLYTSRMPSSA